MNRHMIFTGMLLITSFAAGLAHAGGAEEGEVVLLSPEQQPRAIVIGSDTTAPEMFAARELEDYLKKLIGSGVEVMTDDNPIPDGLIIAVGRSTLTEGLDIDQLDIEDYIIDVRPNVIAIVGGRKPPLEVGAAKSTWYQPEGDALMRNRGTLYGVYAFLHELGVRWYRPEPWGEHIPEHDTIVLDVGTTQYTPPFPLRAGIGYYGTGDELYPDRDDPIYQEGTQWAVRNHLNTRRGPPALGGYREIRGGGHAYRHLVSARQYFDDHPEYFALIDGERSDAPPQQPCLSNPDVQTLVADKIVERAESNPHLEHLSLAPNDGDGHCECESCVAWDDPDLKEVYGDISNSNRVFRFANIIAEMVEEDLERIGTGQTIFMYAYRDHMEAPTLLDEIHPNISVMMAAYTGNSDYSRRLHDPESRSGGSRGNSRFLKHMNQWLALVPGERFSTYEYWAGYRWPGPFPILRTTIADRIRAYHRKGLEGVYNMAGSCSHWGPQGLNLYMFSRLMWDPEMDLEHELDLYYRNYYGPAAEPMRRYHETLERAMASGEPWVYSGGGGMLGVFTSDLLSRTTALIEEARELVSGDELYEKRLHGVAAGHEFVVRRMKIEDLLESEKIAEARSEGENLLDFVKRNEGPVFAPGYADRRLENELSSSIEAASE